MMTLIGAFSLVVFFFSYFPPAAESQGSRFHKLEEENDYFLTQKEHWFNQTLDHFSIAGHHKFQQRYYEFLDHYQAPKGPVFLVVCGEETCDGIYRSYIAVLAKKFGAALVSLEHRYYGKSSPFNNLTTRNLRFLSSKQALFDMAVFRQYYQEHLNAKYSVAESPWFVIGLSYAGALSAWFHLKFPHLTCGSLASSAAIHMVYNFADYDLQIGRSVGPECKAVLQEITNLAEKKLQDDGKSVKNLLGAPKINDDYLLCLLADAAGSAIQEGSPDELCYPLIDAKKNGTNLLEVYSTYIKNNFLGSYSSLELYDPEYYKNTTPGGNSANRLWWFQLCTEFGNFQVAPKSDAIRSARIDLRWHLDFCKNMFGSVYHKINMTNVYYGGKNISGTKIIFTNGSQDPWLGASKQTSSKDLPTYLIKCHNCAHGFDLAGCPPSASNVKEKCEEAVHAVRQKIIKHMELWLSQCSSCRN
ncbi:putative serine protease EDA2 [Curcuma longa]|uniref:putative serine protease EDA2 n=1 Tax=Curcuma longa TaxID=136217 RepID=UPI003D9EC701